MRIAVSALLFLSACPAAQVPPPGDSDPTPQDRAGWTATLRTLAHGVSGRATIVDEDTIRLDDFFYDGGGIGVYAYLGTSDSNAAFVSGLRTGTDLFGTVFAGESLEIDLPPGETFDNYAAISIWCVDARVNFVSGTFADPE